jgi:hypothetical protein
MSSDPADQQPASERSPGPTPLQTVGLAVYLLVGAGAAWLWTELTVFGCTEESYSPDQPGCHPSDVRTVAIVLVVLGGVSAAGLCAAWFKRRGVLTAFLTVTAVLLWLGALLEFWAAHRIAVP